MRPNEFTDDGLRFTELAVPSAFEFSMWLNFQLNMFDGTKVQKICENTKRNAQMFSLTPDNTE